MLIRTLKTIHKITPHRILHATQHLITRMQQPPLLEDKHTTDLRIDIHPMPRLGRVESRGASTEEIRGIAFRPSGDTEDLCGIVEVEMAGVEGFCLPVFGLVLAVAVFWCG